MTGLTHTAGRVGPHLRSLLAPVLALSLLTLASSCASAHRTSSLPPIDIPVASRAKTTPAPTATDRDRIVAQAQEQVALARDLMKQGKTKDAEEAWNRAIDILGPLATQDESISVQLRGIVAERDQQLEAAELAANGNDTEPADLSEDASAASAPSEQAIVLMEPEPAIDPEHVEEVTEAVHDVTPDYPVEVNDRVLAWLEQWSGRLHDFFAGSLERSGQYHDEFRKIFEAAGLPQDLIFMAHVESGFKVTAYSRARARGIFQFISGTGTRYGLAVNRHIDERADPSKAAFAAAAYLKDLYTEFGDWKLALAAYNAGEGKIEKVIARSGTRDFWNPKFQRYLRAETRNYVPAIFAATLIAKDPAKFGFGAVKPLDPQPFETVEVPKPTNLTALAKALDVDAELLQKLNPALRRGYTPPGGAYRLKVPVGKGEGFPAKYDALPSADKQVAFSTDYRVRKGDTLGSIARRFGTSVSELQRSNGLRGSGLSVGQVLSVPTNGPLAARTSDPEARIRATNAARSATYYRVRKGDTLGSIASDFEVSVLDLANWNSLQDPSALAIGQKLRVKAPVGDSDKAPKVGGVVEVPTTLHVVREGETLWGIAQNYGVDLGALLSANKLSKNTVLHPGMQLTIPTKARTSSSTLRPAANVVHVVQPGETLSKIAARYRISVGTLCQLNQLPLSVTLSPGDTLTISR